MKPVNWSLTLNPSSIEFTKIPGFNWWLDRNLYWFLNYYCLNTVLQTWWSCLKKIELPNWGYSSSMGVAYKWTFTVLIIINHYN